MKASPYAGSHHRCPAMRMLRDFTAGLSLARRFQLDNAFIACPKNKNAGLVGPAASLLLICGEPTGLRLLSPRIFLNCLGPHRYGPLRALLTGPEPNLPALFPVREARSLTFLPGPLHPGRPGAIRRSPGPSGKSAPTRQPHANRLNRLAASRFAELLVR
jgi:hypothetical protein